MVTDIKPIQTEYKGYLFRSRLEARWAVFFDEMGIKYEYEPEGFEMDGSYKYLPDFYLPDCYTYVEIKAAGALKISGISGDLNIENGRERSDKYIKFSDGTDISYNYLIVQGDPYEALTSPEGRKESAGAFLFYKPYYFYTQAHIEGRGNECKDINKLQGEIVSCFVNKKPFIIRSFWDDMVIPPRSSVTIGIIFDESSTFINCSAHEFLVGSDNTKRCSIIARKARFEHGEAGVAHE